MELRHVRQPFEPVFSHNSRILILGSLPSVLSRANGFYYGNPRNRLWFVLSALLKEKLPRTNAEKREMLIAHRIAMWDVIHECDIIGSGDASIRNAVPADINMVLSLSAVRHIYLNGGVAGKLYKRHFGPSIALPATVLPSTSPANAAYSVERLLEAWKCIFKEE